MLRTAEPKRQMFQALGAETPNWSFRGSEAWSIKKPHKAAFFIQRETVKFGGDCRDFDFENPSNYLPKSQLLHPPTQAVGGCNNWDLTSLKINDLSAFASIKWDELLVKAGTKFCVLKKSGKTVFLIA